MVQMYASESSIEMKYFSGVYRALQSLFSINKVHLNVPRKGSSRLVGGHLSMGPINIKFSPSVYISV